MDVILKFNTIYWCICGKTNRIYLYNINVNIIVILNGKSSTMFYINHRNIQHLKSRLRKNGYIPED